MWFFVEMIMVLVLMTLAGCFFRLGNWHQRESDYWHSVTVKVLFDPKQDEKYRPILDWARANRPSLWERIRGWDSPEVRMRARSNGSASTAR